MANNYLDPDLNALKHQEMLTENDKDLKELNNTEEDDPPLTAVQSDLPSSLASSKGTSVPGTYTNVHVYATSIAVDLLKLVPLYM